MRRLGIFAFFAFLMSMCFLKIDDGDGGGGDGGDGDIFDEELDDTTPPPPKDGDKKDGDGQKEEKKPPAKDTKPDPDKMLLEEIRQERALNEITKDLKKEYGDFDMEKVISKLKEMEKENPGSGNKLFNKAGIELVHLKYFANQEAEGEFDGKGGRGTKAPTKQDLIAKINKGEASDDERQSFFAEYA